MNVLLGIEALQGRITGIGRYTRHLAAGLAASDEIADLRYFAHGRVLEHADVDDHGGGRGSPRGLKGGVSRMVGRIRPFLARSSAAVAVYERIQPILARRNLERFARSHVLHSPNFVLPEFSGRSIATFHDLSTLLTPQFHPPARVGFLNRAMERTARRADHIITDTEFVRQQVLGHFGLPAHRCTAVPLGADDSFHPRTADESVPVLRKYRLQFKRYLLFVSTIEPRKNLRRVLHAHAACARRHPGCLPLVIVGDPGWRSRREHEMMRRMEGQGRVTYLGYAPGQDLPVLVAGARALVFPSLYEGFGLPVLEAMQSGTAVLTSSASAMEEVCGGAAVTVEPRSAHAIADAMRLLMDDDALEERLIAAGLERARQFSWERCAAATVAAYRRCA
jgi:glycosyltransferase involved in cell wall biosynthesis